MPRPKIRTCSIADPFVLIVREDDSIGLFIGETERGKIRRKDMSPMGDKVGWLFSLSFSLRKGFGLGAEYWLFSGFPSSCISRLAYSGQYRSGR